MEEEKEKWLEKMNRLMVKKWI